MECVLLLPADLSFAGVSRSGAMDDEDDEDSDHPTLISDPTLQAVNPGERDMPTAEVLERQIQERRDQRTRQRKMNRSLEGVYMIGCAALFVIGLPVAIASVLVYGSYGLLVLVLVGMALLLWGYARVS